MMRIMMTQVTVALLVEMEGEIHIWISDEEVDQRIIVEWQNDPYHLDDVPEP